MSEPRAEGPERSVNARAPAGDSLAQTAFHAARGVLY